MSDVVKDANGFEVEDRIEYGVMCRLATESQDGDGFMYNTQEQAENRAQGCVNAGHGSVEIRKRQVTVRIGPWETVNTLKDDTPDEADTRTVQRKK